MKNILIYCWNAVSEPMTIEGMKSVGYQVAKMYGTMNDYHADAEFAQRFMARLHEVKPDIVFSYDYFPLISMICEMNQVPYAAWIYDCPMYTLLSKTNISNNNYIFCFDRLFAERLIRVGIPNVYHFPLAGDTALYARAKRKRDESIYSCDISFVGGLYNGEKNRLLTTKLSEYAEGYVEGLLCAQNEVCGYNMIRDALPMQIAEEITEKCDIELNDAYTTDVFQMAADAINMKLTARDRENILATLTERYDVTLYSNSELPERLRMSKRLICKGAVDYCDEMPLIFHNSKINLNITSRTIESGISQRVFDILACGGFCLTNYQPEIDEFFEDGKELVMYTDVEDMLNKVEYYLEHEEERIKIAQNGYKKLQTQFDIKDRIVELLNMI